jgi:hypothetical protein
VHHDGRFAVGVTARLPVHKIPVTDIEQSALVGIGPLPSKQCLQRRRGITERPQQGSGHWRKRFPPREFAQVSAFAVGRIDDDVAAERLRHKDSTITLRPSSFEPAGRGRHGIAGNP